MKICYLGLDEDDVTDDVTEPIDNSVVEERQIKDL